MVLGPVAQHLAALEKSERQPPAEREAAERGALARLAAHALATVPYYARHRIALEAIVATGAASDAWRALPTLGRASAQEAGSALHSLNLPKGHGPVGEVFTSGSTGQPLRALRTQSWADWWRAITLRDHIWQRRDLAATLAAVRDSTPGKFAWPRGGVAPSWGAAERVLGPTGPAVSLNLGESPARQAEWLARTGAAYLLTLPSNAEALALHCRDEEIALPQLRQVITIAEMLNDDTRTLVREVLGVGIDDIYSTREVGYVALQCPMGLGYHVQSEVTHVEILDDAGRPVPEGGIGRVVVTALHNYAMPLLRYELGDLAELGSPCPCGRGLPVLRRVVGRTQHMIRLPSGERRLPMLSSGALRALLAAAPVRRYQLVQTRLDALELRLVVGRPLNDGERATLIELVRGKYGYPFAVEVTEHADLARTRAGKFMDFVSLLP